MPQAWNVEYSVILFQEMQISERYVFSRPFSRFIQYFFETIRNFV